MEEVIRKSCMAEEISTSEGVSARIVCDKKRHITPDFSEEYVTCKVIKDGEDVAEINMYPSGGDIVIRKTGGKIKTKLGRIRAEWPREATADFEW